MRAQSEIIVFVLLFLIGVILFVSAVVWSSDMFERNVDITNVAAAEDFMRDLDDSIKSVVRFGGSKSINYPLAGTIELVDENTLEIKLPISAGLPDYWINLTSDSSYIREIQERDLFRIQLIYPGQEPDVELFTEGPRLSSPNSIRIEEYSSEVDEFVTVRIKITFL